MNAFTPGAGQYKVDYSNLVIVTSSGGQKVGFSVLMTNAIPSLHMVDIDGSQCFPMFLYEAEGGK